MKKFKKTIAIILCLVLATSGLAFAEEAASTSAPSTDYAGHWAESTIQKWMDAGKISGYSDGSYKPDNNITRAEFVKLVNGTIDFSKKANVAYKDVTTADWFYDYVGIAQEIGYISGYSKDSFGPNDYITREQAASILARIQYLNGNSAAANKFSDKSKVSSWAAESVGAAYDAGFITGYNDGTFRPSNKLTRAEALTMLDNVLVNAKNVVVYKDGTELKDKVVEGDLIIAKTVGDGNVHLTNVVVKGEIKVLGGGLNSVYFNNVKVSNIEVLKDKVRLVFADGSVIENITTGSETVLENTDGTIAKITVTGDSEVTLTGNFGEVTVTGSSNIILDDAVITKLVVEQKITIEGTGTIATLEANANGIQFEAEVKITKTVTGEGVTEKPAVVVEAPAGGGGGGGGAVEEPVTSNNVIISVNLTDANDSSKSKELTYTTNEYSDDDILAYFAQESVHDMIYNAEIANTLSSLLNSINMRLDNITINGVPAYSEEGWAKATAYFAGTSYVDASLYDETKYFGLNDSDLITAVLNGIDINDLQNIEYTFQDNLVYASEDLEIIKANLTDYPFDAKEILYNDKPVTYSIVYGNTTLDTNQKVADYIFSKLMLSTQPVKDFFAIYGDTITITMTSDVFNGEIIIKNNVLN